MNHLAKNICHLRKQQKKSQEKFAAIMEVPRSRISSYEEGRSTPSIDFLIKLSDYFKIPIDIIIRNDLTVEKEMSFIELRNKRILFPITVDNDNEDLIEIIPAKAQAGYLSGYDDPEYIEQLKKIKLPFLPVGLHRAFPIQGDSMLPLKSGSFVVGKMVEDVLDIKSGRTYVLITVNDGIVYKRVENNIDENETLKLISDNRTYNPYDIHISEVIELWEFSCAINTQEYSESELKLSSILNMFNELGIELESLKKLVS
ncbi:helix-turn-helix domain-containing protein [Flavobacteriaceae bacterium]|nr:helix-turn-helix domain-containing protein [Flavobacteriaceae bacterium]